MVINVRETLRKHGIFPKKKYGQNFLVDPRVTERIADAVKEGESGLVIEIGAGIGNLTAALSSAAEKVAAFEIDKAMLPILAENLSALDNIEIINADALKADFAEVAARYGYKTCTIAANLPYYITTPLIFKILESGVAGKAILMTQKEVADRILATAGSADYGALSLTVGFYGKTRRVTNVPPNCFVPRPDVDSSVIAIDIFRPEERACPPDEQEFLFALIKAAFSMRRKTLVNCFASIGISKEKTAKVLAGLGLDVNVRGEMLPLEEFVALAGVLRE